MKYYIIAVVVILVLASALCFFYFMPRSEEYTTLDIETVSIEEADVVIIRTEDGYEPRNIEIMVGDTVLFTNESTEYHWPASNIHPTHGLYPEFDPLRPIAPGESWGFTFTKSGEWKFHDHLRANLTGTILVR